MKNKYDFLKTIYKNKLVVFKKKNNIKSFGIDQMILYYLKIETKEDLKKVNFDFILFDNFDIIDMKIEGSNKYNNYVLIVSLLKKLKGM